MKKLLILLFSILISFNSYGLFEKTVCVETDSQLRDGVIYLPNKTKPFSGNNLCEYESGQYKSKGKIKDGKKNELWTEWEENGQIKFELIYVRGQKEQKKNYQNGELFNETTYVYYDNGLIEQEVNFKDGKLNGKRTSWNQNGQKKLEGNYKDDKLDGKWTWWLDNGQKSQEEYYKDGNKERRIYYGYYPNGQIKEEQNYKDDKFNGKVTNWFENGQKELEANYKDGEKDGKWTWWNENGQIYKVENYKDGRLTEDRCWNDVDWWLEDDLIGFRNNIYTGDMTCRHPNGNLMQTGFIANGKREGQWNLWSEDGTMTSQVYFIDDKEEGNWWWFDGKRKIERVYKDGECVSGDCPD